MTSSSYRLHQKRKADDDLDKRIAAVDDMLAKSREVDDEAASFGKSIAAKMRKFTKYKMALARMRIENVLFDVEFKAEAPHSGTL